MWRGLFTECRIMYSTLSRYFSVGPNYATRLPQTVVDTIELGPVTYLLKVE